jgi:protein gp37
MGCQSCGWRGDFKDTIAAGMKHVCPKCEGELEWTRRRVFPSMCDPFEDNKQVANWRGAWFLDLIPATPNIDWLLLTKRPERMFSLGTDAAGKSFDLWLAKNPNVWLGTSVENQDCFDERVGRLVKYGLQARVLFLSVEPMIGPVRLVPTPTFSAGQWEFVPGKNGSLIDWVICGGESGHGCRPMDVQWARDLRDDCRTHGVKFFMKQLGGFPDKRDGLEDLPVDLRVREVPTPSPTLPQIQEHLEEGESDDV